MSLATPNLHVLVIDDDFDYLAVMSACLCEEGFRVTTATTPPDVWWASEISPDRILLDIMFRGRPDGLHFLYQIHRAPSLLCVPIVVSSAASLDATTTWAISEFGAQLLPKPFDLGQLIVAVTTGSLDGHSPETRRRTLRREIDVDGWELTLCADFDGDAYAPRVEPRFPYERAGRGFTELFGRPVETLYDADLRFRDPARCLDNLEARVRQTLSTDRIRRWGAVRRIGVNGMH